MDDTAAAVLTCGLAILSLAGFYRARSHPSFGLLLINRWLRWLLFGVGFAYVMRSFEWTERPYWALAPSLLLFWILLESVYTWMAVRALSHSPIPVYPKYRNTEQENIWPVDPPFLKIRDEIRELGFQPENDLLADLGEGLALRSTLYLTEDRTVRLQVLFVPRATGNPIAFFIFVTQVEDGLIISDNVSLPFGGVSPSTWCHKRKPFVSSIHKLYRIHQKQIERVTRPILPAGEDLLEELNEEQRILDRVSTESGILLPQAMRPDQGKLSGDGRYLVWKQILLLNYFGKVGSKSVK